MTKHSKRDVSRLYAKWLDITNYFSIGGTEVTSTAAELNILDGVTATATELNEINDMSAKVVAPATGNLAMTQALHGNRILYYNDADGAVTLPAATGTGYTYLVVIKTSFTGGTIKCASGTDDFLGGCSGMDTDVDGTAKAFSCDAGDDTVTLNGVATGGIAGDWIRFTDVASAKWLVDGWLSFSGGSEVTPFSATL